MPATLLKWLKRIEIMGNGITDRIINRFPRRRQDKYYDLGDTFAAVKGRFCDEWVQGRAIGFTDADTCENPALIIESLLRNELWVERGLEIASVTSTTQFVVNGLRYDKNDYYNDAYIVHVSGAVRDTIADYDASTNTITTSSAHAGWVATDKVYIININNDARLDTATIDALANSTDGKRKDWLFANSIHNRMNLSSILAEILFESHCLMFMSYKQYKVIALDEEAGAVDTWTNPLKQKGIELVGGTLTPLANIFTDFTLKYYYDYGAQEYQKELTVNKNDSTSASDHDGNSLSTYETNCGNAETNYKYRQKFDYACNWIYDQTTACSLLIKLVTWFTKQRLIVRWGGDCKTYIKYELGDQVKLNYSKLIPSGLNNSAKFMIFNKTIYPENPPYVVFDLIQMS